jgi:hypothetical protein
MSYKVAREAKRKKEEGNCQGKKEERKKYL